MNVADAARTGATAPRAVRAAARRTTLRVVGQPIAHDSAAKHVSGAALYVDDVPEPRDLLHAYRARCRSTHMRA